MHFLQQLSDGLDRIRDLGAIFTAGLGLVGLSAAPAVREFGDLADQLTSVDALLHQVVADGTHKAGLSVSVAAENDHAAFKLLAQTVHQLAQRIHWHFSGGGREQRHIVNLVRERNVFNF